MSREATVATSVVNNQLLKAFKTVAKHFIVFANFSFLVILLEK